MNKFIPIVLIFVVTVASLGLYFVFMPKKYVVSITEPLDDGVVYILRDYGPEAGYTWGGGEGALVGVAAGGEHNTTSRALYRFKITEWTKGDITLHLYCTIVKGTPGKVEVYVVNDFSSLPQNQTGDPHDVSSVWNLVESGEKIAELSLSEGSWFEVKLSSSVVSTYKTSTGYLAIMIKLEDETLEGEHYYGLLTYEYATKNNMDPPYLTWKE